MLNNNSDNYNYNEDNLPPSLTLNAITDSEFLVNLNVLMEKLILVPLTVSACNKIADLEDSDQKIITQESMNKESSKIMSEIQDLILNRCEECIDIEFERGQRGSDYIPGLRFAKDLDVPLMLWCNIYSNKDYYEDDDEEDED